MIPILQYFFYFMNKGPYSEPQILSHDPKLRFYLHHRVQRPLNTRKQYPFCMFLFFWLKGIISSLGSGSKLGLISPNRIIIITILFSILQLVKIDTHVACFNFWGKQAQPRHPCSFSYARTVQLGTESWRFVYSDGFSQHKNNSRSIGIFFIIIDIVNFFSIR